MTRGLLRIPLLGAVPAALMLVVALAVAGCTSSSDESKTSIVIKLPGRTLTGALDQGAAAASLLSQLPLTLSFRDFGGQEKIADLPAPLDLRGAPTGSAAAPLTIGYYAPSQGLVLYYTQVGYFAGIVPIGTFDDVDAVRSQTGDFTATIRITT